jgi:hypothetical protein
MFNVYKNQLSRQAGSKNLTGPKTLSTLWHTYMKLVTKYHLPSIVAEKIATKNILDGRTDGKTEGRTDGRTDGRKDGQTDRGKTYTLLK